MTRPNLTSAQIAVIDKLAWSKLGEVATAVVLANKAAVDSPVVESLRTDRDALSEIVDRLADGQAAQRLNLTLDQIAVVEELVWAEVVAADKRFSVEAAKDEEDNTVAEQLRRERDALHTVAVRLGCERYDAGVIERAAYRAAAV